MKTAREFFGPAPLTAVDGTRGKHWIRHEQGDRLWLVLDREGASTNTLDEDVLTELGTLIEEAEAGDWNALMFRSAKPSGFAAGADIHQFVGVTDAAAIREKIDRANAVFDRIAALRIPTVAVVHGVCVGGGLELALTCDRIIAREDANIGLPEILLGLHPGLGGTARLTHRIAPVEAMKLMLTGRTLRAKKARKLGIVDAVVPERDIANAVEAAVSGRLERRSPGTLAGAMNLIAPRTAAGVQMRAETEKRAPKAHYPAPHALIDLWIRHGGSERDMLKAERASFARLLPTETAQNLIRAFFLRERLKANGKGRSGIGHVHVVGAGTMGADIGIWCALRGLRVTIEDPDRAALGRATKNAYKLFERRLDGADLLAAKDRFTPDTHGNGVRHADLVIEAGPERAELKREIYARIERDARDDVILATNTSSLNMDVLAEGLKRPERFVGIHFFNPVSKLELVEVVRHDGTDAWVYETAQRFVADIGRLPLPVKAAPGFLVNRALMPYLGEAFLLVEEGVQPERIDAAARAFGMPMGPIELADQVGLDICLAVAKSLAVDLDRPTPAIPAFLSEKVEKRELGRKTGHGLYTYDAEGKPKKSKVREAPDDALRDRLILPMLDAVVASLDEGVVADPDSADAAMIFATGFAPFRGGPMHYARQRGFAEIAATLDRLAAEHGPRFEPSGWWRKED